MKPAYLRSTKTGECFAYSPYLEVRGDMVPWVGLLPWEKKEEAVVPVKPAIAIPLEPVKSDSPKSEEAEQDEPTSEFVCEVCGFVAKTKMGLNAHARTHKKK